MGYCHMKNVSPNDHALLSPLTAREDGVNGGLSLGLLAVTLPTVGYSLVQLSHLLSGENLQQAIRAFAP